MKRKSFSVVLIALLIAMLTANIGMAAPAGPYNEVRLSSSNNGGQVTLGANDMLVVQLRSNPSTGYRWDVQNLNNGIVTQVKEDADFAEMKTAQLLGASTVQTLRFQGVSKGSTTLTLVYHRAWEKESPALETYSIQIKSLGAFVGTYSEPAKVEESAEVEMGDPAILAALPSHYNVCENGGCTPVRNQGNCGSCWAFGTVGVFESKIKVATGTDKDLSEQYLVSCNSDGYGCDGGWFAHAYHINKIPSGETAAGAVYEAAFPYKAADVACNPPHAHNEKLTSWRYIKNSYSVPTTAAIKQAIYTYGAVAAAVCVGSKFQAYTSGIFSSNECSSVNHAILLVGWDDTQGVWYLRNSWGSSWGESGYMRIKYGTSKVGYGANYAVYTSLATHFVLGLDDQFVDAPDQK